MRFFVLSLFMVIFLGCSSTQHAVLEIGPSVDLSLEVRLEPFFGAYLRDLGGAQMSRQTDAALFDDQAIRQSLEELGVRVLDISGDRIERVSLQLRIPDLPGIAGEKIGQELIRWNPSSQPAELRISLGPESVRKILAASGLVEAEGLEYLLPSPGARRTDYRDDLVWIFEEYLDEAPLVRALDAASVRLTIRTPRPIASLSGMGLSRSGPSEAVLNLPVLELLTLNASRVYVLRY